MKRLWCFAVILMGCWAYGVPAGACVGSKSHYDVNLTYESGAGDDLAVEVIKDKTSSQFLLDDTGYLGSHLVVVNLVKKNKDQGTVDFKKNQKEIQFFKERLRKLKRSLMPFDNDLKFTKKIQELDELIDSDISVQELSAKWSELGRQLYQNQIQIRARIKDKAEGDWSTSEVDVHDVDLPDYQTLRNVSACGTEMGGFNITPNSPSQRPIKKVSTSKRSHDQSVTVE